MRTSLRVGGIALALCAGIGFSAAQTSGPGEAPAAENPVPPPRLPTQPPTIEADNAKPTMRRPSHDATAGQVAEQVPGATPQTMPSTISAENAAQDKLPTIAFQFPLTAEQKSRIAASLAKASVAPVGNIDAKVTQSVPSSVMLQRFSDDVTAEIPNVAQYRYVNLSDRVLIVDAPNWTVVGEIKK